MNAEHIRAFITVVEEGSLARAAEKMYISTPSLHQQIHLLEKEVGFQLFVKKGRSLELTEAGRFFYTSGKRVIQELDHTISEGKKIEHSSASTLTIGYLEAGDIRLIKNMVQKNLEYSIKPMRVEWKGFDSIRSLLEQKVIDLMYCENVYQNVPSIGFQPFFYDPVVVMMSDANPLHTRNNLGKKDLSSFSVYAFSYDEDNPAERSFHEAFPEIVIHRIPETDFEVDYVLKENGLILGENMYLKKYYTYQLCGFADEVNIEYGFAWNRNNHSEYLRSFLVDMKKAGV